MIPKTTTQPNLALTSPIHQQAIAEGYEWNIRSSRNVIDRFKDWSNEDIRVELQKTANPFAVCMENWTHDLNISTCFRNANAFNARECFYIGNKRFDHRGCQGTQNYNNFQWLETMDQLIVLKDKYTFIGIDNIEGSKPIENYQFQPNTMLIFGSEGVGITDTVQKMCQDIVHITQMGSVRSINAASASAIAMYEFVKQIKGK